MKSLYVVSTESACGKTALIVGLMTHLREEGFDPGYFKPVSGSPRALGEELVDLDARFVKGAFDLSVSLEQLAPILLTDSLIDRALGKADDLLGRVRTAYEDLSAGGRGLLVEGAGDLAEGGLLGLAAAQVADALELPVLLVTRYVDRLAGDDLLLAARTLGPRLIGAVVNGVPEHALDLFHQRVVPVLEAQGVPVMGLIPYRRLLEAASVDELVEQIDGEYLVGQAKAEQLVETLCIGAMDIDHVLTHFRRQRNKVVVAEAARTDVLLAALETSTQGLILTGKLGPRPVILERAEKRGVPVLRSPRSTLETVEAINVCFGRTRFHQPEKFDVFRQALEANLDWARLYQAMEWNA